MPTTYSRQSPPIRILASSAYNSQEGANSNVRAKINQYLFYELGIKGEERRVSESWPFQLRELGARATGEKASRMFEFRHGRDEYFVEVGNSLGLWIKDGMSREDLRLYMLGERWLAEQRSVDLDTTRPGDWAVPSVETRRRAMLEMAREAAGEGKRVEILEDLFFPSQRRYLALIKDLDTGHTFLIGSDVALHRVKPSQAAPWRRLASAVGELLAKGALSPLSHADSRGEKR